MKLNAQFAEVDKAFAGARIRNGTISAGYSHVIPSHPIEKKVLNRKRKRAATVPEPFEPILVIIVSITCRPMNKMSCYFFENWPTIEKDIPATPNNIN